MHQELQSEARIVTQNDRFIAIEPFAARFPFETRILPIVHAAQFETADASTVDALGSLLREVLLRMRTALDEPPFNYVLHTAPTRGDGVGEFYHWHLEIMPKLTRVAGFEWGSGFYINPTPPEVAADELRRVSLDRPARGDS